MTYSYRVITEHYNIVIIKLDEDSNVVDSLTVPLGGLNQFLDQLNSALETAEEINNKPSPIFDANNFARKFFDN